MVLGAFVTICLLVVEYDDQEQEAALNRPEVCVPHQVIFVSHELHYFGPVFTIFQEVLGSPVPCLAILTKYL